MTRGFVAILALVVLAGPAWAQGHGGNVEEAVAGSGGRRAATMRPAAPIDGFRSGRFGMDEAALRRAIARDFGPVPVERDVDGAGRVTLAARLRAPFPAGGDGRGAWILAPGRGLVQIALAWPAAEAPPPGELADAAGLLRDHLASYGENRLGLIVDQAFPDGGRLVILNDGQGRGATLAYGPAVAGHREDMTLVYSLPEGATATRDPSQ